jgi:hypothetical protein
VHTPHGKEQRVYFDAQLTDGSFGALVSPDTNQVRVLGDEAGISIRSGGGIISPQVTGEGRGYQVLNPGSNLTFNDPGSGTDVHFFVDSHGQFQAAHSPAGTN